MSMKIHVLKTALALGLLSSIPSFAQDMDIYVYGDVMDNVRMTNDKTKMTYDASKDAYVIKGVNITCEDGYEDGDFVFKYVKPEGGTVTYGAYDPWDEDYVYIDIDEEMNVERGSYSWFEVPETSYYDIEFNVEDLTMVVSYSDSAPEKTSLYGVGDFNNWDYDNPLEFTYKPFAGFFTTEQEITSAGFRISKNGGSREAFDQGGLCLESGKTINNDGDRFTLVTGTDIINVPWPGEYYLRVSESYSWISAETDTPDPNAPIAPRSISPSAGTYPKLQTFTVSFDVDLDRLDTSKAITLTGDNGDEVPVTYEIRERSVIITAADPVVEPGEYLLTMPEGAVKMASGVNNKEKSWKYTIIEQIPMDIYVYGDVVDHIRKHQVPEAKMTMGLDNVYTINGVALTGDDTAYGYGQFKFEAYNQTTEECEYTIAADGSQNTSVEPGVPIRVKYESSNWLEMDIEDTVLYDMTLDLNEMTLLVREHQEAPDLYLVGDANEWNYADPIVFTRNENGYILEDVELTENGFLFSTVKGNQSDFATGGLSIAGEILTWGNATALETGSKKIYPEYNASATITVNADLTSVVATTEETSDFSKWEEVGTGTYTDYDKNTETGKTLMMRRSKADSNLLEYKIMNIRQGMDLVFSCDDKTGVIIVPKQPTGERVDFFNADVMVADINNYLGGYTPYKELSHRFDANGLFDLNIVFYISDDIYISMGRNTFRLDGNQYEGNFKLETDIDEIAYTDGEKARIELRRGMDIKDVVYTVTDRLGNVSEPVVSTGRILEIPLSMRGSNIVKIFGRNEDDQYVAYAQKTVYYEPAETDEWTSLGQTDYTDDIVAVAYYFEPQTYKVEIQRNKKNENLYRLINPYGVNSPYYTPDGWYNTAFTNYLVIDCTDSEKVFIEQNALGINLGDGKMSVASSAYMMEQNSAPSELTDDLWGKFENQNIILPVRSVKYNFSGQYGWFNAISQVPSGIQISIPKESGLTDVNITGESDTVYYRLDGTQVMNGNLEPGVYIRKDEAGTKKVIVK